MYEAHVPLNEPMLGGPRPVPWGPRDVALGLALSVAGVVIVAGIYALVTELADADVNSAVAFAVVGGTIYFIVLWVSWVMGPRRGDGSLASLGLRLPEPSARLMQLVLLPGGAVLASLVLTVLYALLISQLGVDLPEAVPEDLELKGPTLIGVFALAVAWGPLAEEVFFRGFVLGGLMDRFGVRGAAVASSLLFAAAHLDPRVMLPIFVTGLLLAWLYVKTNSLASPLVAHAAQNAFALAVATWA